MKKFFIPTFAFMAIAFTTFSQNPVTTAFDSPMKNMPKNLSYSNYKTYSPFISIQNVIKSEDKDISKSFEGSDYSLGFYSLLKSGDDADFKIIVLIRLDYAALAKTTTKDSLVAVCNHTSTIEVYDKKGNSIYNKEANGSVKSGEKGDFNLFTKKEEIEKHYLLLLRTNIEKIVISVARPFEEKFFPTVQFVHTPFMEFATSFKSDSTIKQTERVIHDIDAKATAGQPENYIETIRKYIPYWESLTQAPEGKKQDNIKLVGFYNLWASNLILNDTVKANQIYTEHPDIAHSQRLFLQAVKKAKYAFAELQAPPVIKGPIHPDNLPSSVTFNDLADKMKYITFKGKGVSSTGEQTGTFKIEKPENKDDKASGGINNLSRKDIEVIYIDGSGTQTKMKISDYTTFIDEEGNDYIVKKTSGGALGQNTFEIFKSVKKNARISAYKDIFTKYSVFNYRKAGTTELFTGKFFKEAKSMAEYFSDCSSLAEKLGNKEIKSNDYEQICDMYEKCK